MTYRVPNECSMIKKFKPSESRFLKHMGFRECHFKIFKPSFWEQTTIKPKPSGELSQKVFVSSTAGPNFKTKIVPILQTFFEIPSAPASTWSMLSTAELLRALSRLCFKLPDGKLPHGKLDKPVSAICSVFSSQAVWSSSESSHCCISRSILLWCFSRIFSKPPMRASRHAAAALGASMSDERLLQAPQCMQNSCNSSWSLRLEKGSCGTGAGHSSQQKSKCHVRTKYNCKVAVLQGSGDQEICYIPKTAS